MSGWHIMSTECYLMQSTLILCSVEWLVVRDQWLSIYMHVHAVDYTVLKINKGPIHRILSFTTLTVIN